MSTLSVTCSSGAVSHPVTLLRLFPGHLPSLLKNSLVRWQRGHECVSSCELCGLSLHEGVVALFSFERVKSQAEYKFCVLF